MGALDFFALLHCRVLSSTERGSKWAYEPNLTVWELAELIWNYQTSSTLIIFLASVLRFFLADTKRVLIDNMVYTLQQYITLKAFPTSKKLIVIGSCSTMDNEQINPNSK